MHREDWRPFDDTVMEYDYRHHRYVLTERGVLEELGEDLRVILNADCDANPTTLPQRFLQKVSQVVYNYIRGQCSDWNYIEHILACDRRIRYLIEEMLIAQTAYVLQNGFTAMSSGIDASKGSVTDIFALRGWQKVADEVVTIVDTPLPYYGFALGYMGRIPCLHPCSYRLGY